MKLGVIMDGISRDPAQAFRIMNETGISYTQIQYAWNKEVGEHTSDELRRLKKLADAHGITVTCITKHNFQGLDPRVDDCASAVYRRHMEGFKRSLEAAQVLGAKHVRVMTGCKLAVLWGRNGAEQWIADNGNWDRFLSYYREPLDLAEKNNLTLLAETANNGLITSGYLHKKFVEDLGHSRMKTMWDPANSIVGGDTPFPDGYGLVKASLAEVHIKDVKVSLPRATVEFCRLGTGDMAPYLQRIADALRKDYDGVVTLESVYRPPGKTFLDGYLESLACFKELFGD